MYFFESKNLSTQIEYLKGVGPMRAEVLQKEKGIFRFSDLVQEFPFRYIDKSEIKAISSLRSTDDIIQVKGVLTDILEEGQGRKKRLKARIEDRTGQLELIWFQGAKWVIKQLEIGGEYLVFGKLNYYKGKRSIAHPELEKISGQTDKPIAFSPVYSSTEKLTSKSLDARGIRRLQKTLFQQLTERDFPEVLPEYLIQKLKFCSRYEAFKWIHFPPDRQKLLKARNRLKFEELFFLQLRLINRNLHRKETQKSFIFKSLGTYFNGFFHNHLPFELTDAQKRVLREVRKDVLSGSQMNRLIQGDVGSGKTVVAFMSMLMAIDNGYQVCMMAPTEILARQHLESIEEFVADMDLKVALLTGSIKGKERKAILSELESGNINILIGTHAIIEDSVIYKNLGLAITDEQHRFGVAQRAKLWQKSSPFPPHVLVMTATPIPRTLAMTFYGDLDVSIIDELPPGRKPIKTMHIRDGHRPRLNTFMKEQIKAGRQIYIVYPLIEESSKLDLQNLQDGYDYLLTEFPRPEFQIGIVHGKMLPKNKDYEMQRFASGKNQILVSTTVIEVGVNVPNASVMVIENAERFGLSQLHQLRGRVGRGASQSYCLLVSGNKLTNDAKQRLKIMCETQDGFKISEADLQLRGPGDIEGTRQSGDLDFKLASLAEDGRILQTARNIAKAILEKDQTLQKDINKRLRIYLKNDSGIKNQWSKIG